MRNRMYYPHVELKDGEFIAQARIDFIEVTEMFGGFKKPMFKCWRGRTDHTSHHSGEDIEAAMRRVMRNCVAQKETRNEAEALEVAELCAVECEALVGSKIPPTLAVAHSRTISDWAHRTHEARLESVATRILLIPNKPSRSSKSIGV